MRIKIIEKIFGQRNTYKGKIRHTPVRNQLFVVELDHSGRCCSLTPRSDVAIKGDCFEFTTSPGAFYRVEPIDDSIESIW